MYSHPCECRSGCTHSFYQAFLFLELCDVTENGGAARTERSPMYRSIFLIAGIFFFSKFMLINISVVNILSSAAESTLRVSISSQPISPSETNKNAAHMMSKRRDEGLLSELQD